MTKLQLLQAADALLKKSNYDALTGEKKDARYKRKLRVEADRARRRSNLKAEALGKLGAASRCRVLVKDGKPLA